MSNISTIIDAAHIDSILRACRRAEAAEIYAILDKAKAAQGLDLCEVATLMAVENPELKQAIFAAARTVKEAIYSNRMVLFAPLYISNRCSNVCTYCAFSADNAELRRRALSLPEICEEVKMLVDQGHKRVLLVAGEAHDSQDLPYILNAIDTIYSVVDTDRGAIRRINVNIAPLDVEGFRQLRERQIGTYQLFQETYHPEIYRAVHVRGKKADYNWRLTAMDRAMQAGIDDLGIGVLFGLADWRFEVLALLQHAQHLQHRYGIGPHTISIPRLEPALGSELSQNPPHAVSDADFHKLTAILRLAVPYTGIILSTREDAKTRRQLLALGVSQISAGSRTNPGGYAESEANSAQFALGDHRPLDEVVRDVASMGYIPSFCTACYRLGRTGHDFMELAKPGAIKDMCTPNGLVTFYEYLIDYASPETRAVGEACIHREMEKLDDATRATVQTLMQRLDSGVRDVFV